MNNIMMLLLVVLVSLPNNSFAQKKAPPTNNEESSVVDRGVFSKEIMFAPSENGVNISEPYIAYSVARDITIGKTLIKDHAISFELERAQTGEYTASLSWPKSLVGDGRFVIKGSDNEVLLEVQADQESISQWTSMDRGGAKKKIAAGNAYIQTQPLEPDTLELLKSQSELVGCIERGIDKGLTRICAVPGSIKDSGARTRLYADLCLFKSHRNY
jgi:hypothetical protein